MRQQQPTTTLMLDVNNGEHYAGEEGVYDNSVLPAQLFCKSKTVLESKGD